MKGLGRWMPMLGVVGCLAATGCRKEEPSTPPPPPPAPTQPAPVQQAPAPRAESPAPTTPTEATPPTPVPPQPAAQVPPPTPGEPAWTTQPVNIPRAQQPMATLREVRSARNEGFDRVVFQFEGDQVPGYRVEYLKEPAIKCGSGDAVELAGEGRLQVSLTPAQAHVGGELTVSDRERKPALPLLAELKQTCDFEGEVTWVFGVKQPHAYRVLELKGPSRLVVDVQH